MSKISHEENQKELVKYRDLNLAALEYKTSLFFPADRDIPEELVAYHKSLPAKVHELFEKGQLTKLKQWFRDFTEGIIEARDLKFDQYLKEKTGYDVSVFKSYEDKITRIIAKGKITTDNQFYDVGILVNELCQTQRQDTEKIELLNSMLREYEQRKAMRK